MNLICLKRVVKLTVTYSDTNFYFQFNIFSIKTERKELDGFANTGRVDGSDRMSTLQMFSNDMLLQGIY